MLKRLLASMAITSLVLACVLLVYWWRAGHGYSDEFTLGRGSTTPTNFRTSPGQVWVKAVDNQSSIIADKSIPYHFSNILGYLLLIPGLWLAIKIRSWLPRPPGMKKTAR